LILETGRQGARGLGCRILGVRTIDEESNLSLKWNPASGSTQSFMMRVWGRFGCFDIFAAKKRRTERRCIVGTSL
jgi:hypothetical protein